MPCDFDAAVIGGGVVGLAVADALAAAELECVLFERHDAFGRETSSRNSEVVHAGIYYASGSLKARLCVSGRRMLYDFCQAAMVPHRRCGKLIVAVNQAQVPELVRLKTQGEANGVEGLALVDAGAIRAREPHVRAVAGLLSPASGILSAHGLMHALAARAGAAGASLVCGARVTGLDPAPGGWTVRYQDSGGEDRVTSRAVVNAAGLCCNEVMRMAGLDPLGLGLGLHLCKGEYFSVQGEKRRLVNGLVYPTPRANLLSLGIHTVPGLGGELRLGPSAFYVEAIDYSVDPANAAPFLDGVRGYLPFVEPGDLAPDMSGIRPKLSGPGEPARDFHIAREGAAAAPGFFNLAGIDSPGLTSCLAIGEHVAGMVREYI